MSKTETATRHPALDHLPAIFADAVAHIESMRYNLTAPWKDAHYAYASDGVVLVRVPLGDLDAFTVNLLPDATKRPDVASIFAAGPRSYLSDPMPWPTCITDPVPCTACHGKRFLEGGTCRSCGGDGICICSCCEAEHDCGECDGQGDVGPGPCSKCEGAGIEWEKKGIDVGTANINVVYAAMLYHHGAIVWGPKKSTKKGKNGKVACFKFQVAPNVEGRLMGMLD
jgi:hypothetical protein